VAGVVVFLTIARQDVLDFLYGSDMMSEGEELATLFCVVALAFGL